MGKFLISLLVVLAISIAVCDGKYFSAICHIQPINGSGIVGEIVFSQETPTSLVSVLVSLPTRGERAPMGIHIHQYGDISSTDGLAAGSHFLGAGGPSHGCPGNELRHAGDMGNWAETSENKYLDLITLSGDNSIIGRAVIVHNHTDDCETVPSSGMRIGQCVIGIANYSLSADTPTNEAYTSAGDVEKLSAVLKGTSGCPECEGMVYFEKENGNIRVRAKATGLLAGVAHGFHIHTHGDLSDAAGISAGPHYNPKKKKHNVPPSSNRHVGDLGNIVTVHEETNTFWYDRTFNDLPSLSSLAGRSIIIHEKVDHGDGYGCDQAGNGGKRMLIGVLGISNIAIPNSPVVTNNTFVSIDCAARVPTKSLSNAIITTVIIDLVLLIGLLATVIFFRYRLRLSNPFN